MRVLTGHQGGVAPAWTHLANVITGTKWFRTVHRMAPIPRGQHLPKATETKAKPGPMPFLGHVHTEPSVGGDLAGAWAAGWEVKAATQGDACKQDTSGMQASLAFRGVLQLQYL